MSNRTILILPKLERILIALGENIKLARLRRKLTADLVFTLGMEQDLLKLAADDVVGMRPQDAGLQTKKRGPKKIGR
jgi:hypothetical protein